jgi:hypothetical protein
MTLQWAPITPQQGGLIMHPKISIFIGSLILAFATGSAAPIVDNALAACSPNDAINGTTATDAAKAMGHAGYTRAQVYQKGCDNAWHAHAMLNGKPTNVVWNGNGQVLPEGD